MDLQLSNTLLWSLIQLDVSPVLGPALDQSAGWSSS